MTRGQVRGRPVTAVHARAGPGPISGSATRPPNRRPEPLTQQLAAPSARVTSDAPGAGADRARRADCAGLHIRAPRGRAPGRTRPLPGVAKLATNPGRCPRIKHPSASRTHP